jgi:hypothetical protein
MGNYSQDPQTVLQNALSKSYTGVRFQQGMPVLDRELNLASDLASPQRISKHHIGNGVPENSDGFQITNLVPADHNFTIANGRCLVNGYEVLLDAQTTYQDQPHKEHVAPLPPAESYVYLRMFINEITGNEDSNLNNSDDVGFETALREKVEWEVLVSAAEIIAPDHILLAKINSTAATVEDRRRTNLTLSTIRDEIDLARGSTNNLNERLSVSLEADGTLISGVVTSVSGWVRLPFLPKKYASESEFEHHAFYSTSGSSGAVGILDIPIPPGATKIKKFQITGVKNSGTILLFLFKTNWNLIENKPVLTFLLLAQPIIGEPFNEQFNLNSNIDAVYGTIGLQIKAVNESEIHLVAVEFE